MKLFLTSNAYSVLDNVLPYLEKPPFQLTVAFIPTASNVYDNPVWLEKDRKKLREMGFIVFDVDIADKSERLIRKELSGVDIIFVAGGNTFYLLEQSNKSGFINVAKELIENGVFYIGSSAGSVLVGPSIAPVDVFDDPSVAHLQSQEGLNIVDFVVLPHYQKGDSQYEDVIKKYRGEYTFIPLTNDQAIIVTDKGHTII